MSENPGYSEALKRIYKIFVVSIILITASGILYILGNYVDTLKFPGLTLAITSGFTFILCLLLLFKRRKEPKAKYIFIQIAVFYFVMILLLYTVVF
ncbi:MAG: hypothetical protein A4E27_01767 [Methanobacterium sp. PtaU1.Bin242]|jgi:hypothetical protein|nr:MAG: hypothetical protein A4E27_01767 [Methanobacterium sp. PtaU1.Bin242]